MATYQGGGLGGLLELLGRLVVGQRLRVAEQALQETHLVGSTGRRVCVLIDATAGGVCDLLRGIAG